MKLFNTLSRQIEEFKPINPNSVTIYSCGPTVYDYAHIGNLRTYVNIDLLKRALIYFDYKIKHVMNITDVGHLTGDDDSGEDKLEKGAKKANKSVMEITKYFTDYFFYSCGMLNILRPNITAPATGHINQMIDLIKILEKKGYTYHTNQAIYFNINRFKSYGQLSKQKITDKIIKARSEVVADPDKKNPADFALWFFITGRFLNHQLKWDSPWGMGFPGWHIECSVMAMNYLGPTIDIHTGGIEHIPVHHENEIAQSQAATGRKFVNFWFHNNHLLVDGTKMSKSLNNFYNIDDIVDKKYNPISLRYLFLQTHYRQEANFTWKALDSAQNAYDKLCQFMLSNNPKNINCPKKESPQYQQYLIEFNKYLSDDLSIGQCLALVWKIIKSDLDDCKKYALVIKFDEVFGLNLSKLIKRKIPSEIKKLAILRQQARLKNDYDTADKIRMEIEMKGFRIIDDGKNYCIK